MQVVYTVPLRIHPVLGWVLRVCTLLICIGAVIFVLVGFVRYQRHPPARPAHLMKNIRPEVVPYR